MKQCIGPDLTALQIFSSTVLTNGESALKDVLCLEDTQGESNFIFLTTFLKEVARASLQFFAAIFKHRSRILSRLISITNPYFYLNHSVEMVRKSTSQKSV